MKLVEIIRTPTDRQLRQFGGIAAVVLPVVAWKCGGSAFVVSILAAVGTAVAALGWFAPQSLRLPFVSLMFIALPIGLVAGEVALLVVYFGVFLPIGLAFRMTKRDSLKLALDRQATSYWQPKPPPRGAAGYYRQF